MSGTDVLIRIEDDTDVVAEIARCLDCLLGQDERPEAVLCPRCEGRLLRWLAISAPSNRDARWPDAEPRTRMIEEGM